MAGVAPGVEQAIRWLLALDMPLSTRELLRRACAARLYHGPRRINGRALDKYIRIALRRESPTGQVIVGIGEIAANCHSNALTILERFFSRSRPRVNGRVLVAQMLDARGGERETTISRHKLAIEQMVESGTPDWPTHRLISWLFEQPFEIGYGRHGLILAMRIALRLSPSDFLAWSACRTAGVVQPLLSALISELYDPHSKGRVEDALIRAQKPSLRLLGALSLGKPPRGAGLAGMEPVYHRLLAAGWEVDDALWIAALPLKAQSHRRFNLVDRLEALEHERNAIVENPANYVGGAERASAGLEMLRQEISEVENCLATVEAAIAASISAIAGIWPNTRPCDGALDRLDDIFVGGAELRQDMARALPAGAGRAALLERTLADFVELIGLDRPDQSVRSYFLTDGDTLILATHMAAEAMLICYSDDAKGPGKRTGQLISPLVTVAQTWLGKPFLRARQPATFQGSMVRCACALVFAFHVASMTKLERRSDVAVLGSLAVEFTENLLRGAPDDEYLSPYLELLAIAAINWMRDQPQDDKRAQWVGDTHMTPFARALAGWTSPAWVDENKEIAGRVFLTAVRPSLRTRPGYLGPGRAFALLDAGLRTHLEASAAIAQLRRLWCEASQSCGPARSNAHLGMHLLDAAKGDPDAIAALKLYPALRRSQTGRAVLERHE